jgi:hypothetical protein
VRGWSRRFGCIGLMSRVEGDWGDVDGCVYIVCTLEAGWLVI